MKTRANIIDDVELLLDDTSNVIWSASTIIDPAVTRALKTVSTFVPQRTNRWLTARHKSKDIDLSQLPDLIYVRYAAYPVLTYDSDGIVDDSDLENRRNVEWDDSFTARLNMSLAPEASVTDHLTGTVTFTAGSTSITGSGTAFTTELRVGFYIRKNVEWYRVAAIASNTALTLSRNVVTADDGADVTGGTDFWDSSIVLALDEEHVLTSQSDLAGAIDAGVAGGYAEGSWMIHVDALGTGTIDKGTLLTIAGCDGTYRVTQDATIGTNEADLYIEPKLKDRAPENAVVTFKPSSLTSKLERIVTELAAAEVVENHASTAYDQIALILTDITNAGTELGLANPEVDLAKVEAALINPEVDLAKTENELANTEVDLAKVESALINPEIDSAKVEAALINPEVDQSVSDADSGRSLANTVPEGAGITDFLNLAQTVLAGANGYAQSANAYSNVAAGYSASSQAFMNTASGYRGTAAGYMNTASGYARSAGAFLANANGYISTAIGNLRQATARANAVQVIMNIRTLALERRNKALAELRSMRRSRTYQMYSRE